MEHADAANSLGSQTLCVWLVGAHTYTYCVLRGWKPQFTSIVPVFLLVLYSISVFPPHPAFLLREKWWEIYNFCGESEAFKHFLDGNLARKVAARFSFFFFVRELPWDFDSGRSHHVKVFTMAALSFCFSSSTLLPFLRGASVKWTVVTGVFWNKRKVAFFLQFSSVYPFSIVRWKNGRGCYTSFGKLNASVGKSMKLGLCYLLKKKSSKGCVDFCYASEADVIKSVSKFVGELLDVTFFTPVTMVEVILLCSKNVILQVLKIKKHRDKVTF